MTLAKFGDDQSPVYINPEYIASITTVSDDVICITLANGQTFHVDGDAVETIHRIAFLEI